MTLRQRKLLPYKKSSGQALPEYGLILVLIALFCFAILQITGVRIDRFFTDFGQQFASLTG